MHGTLNLMPTPRASRCSIIYEGVAGGHYERRTVPVVRADTGDTVEAVTYVALKVGEEPAADARVSRPSAGRQGSAAGRLLGDG